MNDALVSVVLPTYNRGYCVHRSVDAALAQTHRNLEVLLVDDGSTDDTAQVVRQRYRHEPRLRYFHQRNQGVSVARNYALRNARGTFVAFLDSDDVWKPWKLELQIACLDSAPAAGMIWTEMEAVDGTGRVIAPYYLRKYYEAYRWFTAADLFRESFLVPPVSCAEVHANGRAPRCYVGDISSQMIMGNLVHTPTVLLRRERADQVGFFDERLARSGGDFDFHLRTCRIGPVAFLDAAALEYRVGETDQLTTPQNGLYRARNFLATISPFIENERERIRLPDTMLHAVLAEAHAWIAETSYWSGLSAEARQHGFASLRYRPWQPRVTALLLAGIVPGVVSVRIWGAYRALKRGVGVGLRSGSRSRQSDR